MTALWGEAALFTPRYDCNSPVAPTDLAALYRDTALLRDTALFRPPYTGIPHFSDRLIGIYRLVQTAMYRDAALFGPPCIGIPHYSDRVCGGYRLVQAALYRDTALPRPLDWRTPTVTPLEPHGRFGNTILEYVAWIFFASRRVERRIHLAQAIDYWLLCCWDILWHR